MVRTLLASIVGMVVVLSTWSSTGSAVAAPSSADNPSGAAVRWYVTDGCVDTSISLSTSRTGDGTPTTHFFLNQNQTCDDPFVSYPVLTISGSVEGGQLHIGPGFRAHLETTIPVTCTESESGACDEAPYDADTVTVDLTWSTKGRVLRNREDGLTCLYKYGTATGSVLLGGADILTVDGVTEPADTTETNVRRCVG